VLTIRRAELSDAPRIASLSGVLGYPVQPEALAERLAHILGSTEDVVLVAVTFAGNVAGWIHAAEQELLEEGRRCEIVGLVVDAVHRRRGVGRLLVEAAERWATERGLAQISVRSNVVRTESHPFYEELGYVRVKTQHAYRKALGASTWPNER
jgi:GNAT superfamily N-acetyltransferase